MKETYRREKPLKMEKGESRIKARKNPKIIPNRNPNPDMMSVYPIPLRMYPKLSMANPTLKMYSHLIFVISTSIPTF